MGCQTELGCDPDEPLGRVVLVPLDRVAEVHRELVVEVVVALADRRERGDEVVARGVLVVERRLAEPVRERVDAERRVVDEAQAGRAGEEEAAAGVAPAQPCDEGREEEAHADDEVDVPAVLPTYDLVLGQIGDISDTRPAAGLDEHPADVAVPEALVRVVRVEVGVGVAVVCAMATRPPLDGSLDGAGAGSGKEVLQRLGCVVATVCP